MGGPMQETDRLRADGQQNRVQEFPVLEQVIQPNVELQLPTAQRALFLAHQIPDTMPGGIHPIPSHRE